MTFQEHLNI